MSAAAETPWLCRFFGVLLTCHARWYDYMGARAFLIVVLRQHTCGLVERVFHHGCGVGWRVFVEYNMGDPVEVCRWACC